MRIRRRPSGPDPVSTGEGSRNAPPCNGCCRHHHHRPRAVELHARRREGRREGGRGRARLDRRPRHPRVVQPAEEADQEVREGHRAEPRGAALRRRRRAHQQAGAHQGATRSATSPSASTTPSPRGPSTRTSSPSTPPTSRRARTTYALADGERPARPGRPGLGLRQRRQAAGSPTTTSRRRRRSTTSPTRRTRTCFVIPGAPTSSPGLAFLLSTVAEYGEDGWQDYWSRADGQRRQAHQRLERRLLRRLHRRRREAAPARSCSPTTPRRRSPSTKKSGESTTAALLDTCFRQVEYAGVLENAKNPEGAQEVVDFLLERRGPGGAARQHVRLPGRRRRDAARPTGRSSPTSRRRRTTSTRPPSPRTARTG